MDALEALLTRRSTRKFSPQMPDRALIDQVIDAGRHAPSGSNSQTTHLLVITKREVLDKLAILAQDAFARMELTPDLYGALQNSIRASQRGNYVFHYNAPVLVVAANKKGYGNALVDSACVLENMMIAANALDLGSCWINQLHWLDEEPSVRTYLQELGIAEDETITASLALGLPANGVLARKPLERTGNPVTWI